ncbi:hypothetical protein C8Q70DRAFT_1001854 [Cubamyces menziesii]|uniref:Uncharacterized protein n=1 Tax=Trametes cubensis TaxID=1111947 RepID=A0AAD7TTX9_9APHY|nr:hypothetical protein C8Q70DRAFT_1001854 [Cubamyces menziesii]KAJ8482091.1 hypothetical protein ONZ51_g5573 [Trametes cubensis]
MSSRGTFSVIRTVLRKSAARARIPRIAGSSSLHTASFPLKSFARSLSTRTSLPHLPLSTACRYYTSGSQTSHPEVGRAVQSFADPDRPDLFYHLFPAPTSISSSTPVFALSFLSEPPPSVLSCSVIGWLPASGEGEQAGLNDFVENELFREVLHEAVQSALRDGVDEVQKNGAIQTREGWMHIHDNRNIPALGRIGDPDDIIASVRVENGEILAETYQPVPSYRLCTSDGVLQLIEGLAGRLVEVLQTKMQQERSS